MQHAGMAVRDRVTAHRTRLRAQGLRPIQIWVPDVRSADFAAEAHRQSVRVAGGTYEGKPRPALIVQDGRFDGTDSVTVCPLTSNDVNAPLLRVGVQASEENGLDQDSSAPTLHPTLRLLPAAGQPRRDPRGPDDVACLHPEGLRGRDAILRRAASPICGVAMTARALSGRMKR